MEPPVTDPAADALPAPAAPLPVPDERLEWRVVWVWWIADLLRAAVLAGLGWAALFFAQRQWPEHALLARRVYWGAVALWTALAVAVPPLAWRCWRFCRRGDLLCMRYGILAREERLIPVRRMQHIDILRGPIERVFGLATLVVFTAGNEGSAFRVPGLRRERAQALRDGILEARGDDNL